MMPKFKAVVTVECETLCQAERVMSERISPDEDYGFEYTIRYSASRPVDEGRATDAWVLPADLRNQVRAALEGDSNDAEHSALWQVAEYFGIPIDEDEEDQ